MSAPAAGIEVSGVSHRYGGETVLHDIALSLPAGQTIALVGPDGVGKSTLLGLIAGVRKLQSGRISTLGVDIGNRAAREAFLPRLAFMPQGLGKNLYPTLSLRENIDFFGCLFALDARTRPTHITPLLNATRPPPFPAPPPGKLSGGIMPKLILYSTLIH